MLYEVGAATAEVSTNPVIYFILRKKERGKKMRKVLQERLYSLQREKDAAQKQIEDIKADRAKKSRNITSLCTIVESDFVDPTIRDLQLKVRDLKGQIENVSIQLLKRGGLTELERSIATDKRDVAAREVADIRAAMNAEGGQ